MTLASDAQPRRRSAALSPASAGESRHASRTSICAITWNATRRGWFHREPRLSRAYLRQLRSGCPLPAAPVRPGRSNFDAAGRDQGAGFLNVTDRLGALGRRLRVDSARGWRTGSPARSPAGRLSASVWPSFSVILSIWTWSGWPQVPNRVSGWGRRAVVVGPARSPTQAERHRDWLPYVLMI